MKKETNFPYQIHLIIGIIWVLIGAFLQSGWSMVLWVAAGIIFLAIGLLGMKKNRK